MRTLNKKIACVPTEKVSMTITAKRGMAIPDDKEIFLTTTTMFPHRSSVLEPGVTWPAGTIVHLPGEMYKHEWNRKVVTHTDPETKKQTSFILVPEELVVAIEEKRVPGGTLAGRELPDHMG